MNRAARELLGISNTLPTGQLREVGPLFELYDEQGQLLPRELWPQARILSGEVLQGAAAVDVMMRVQDGRKIYLSVTGAPIRAADGNIQGAILACRDVTARQRVERERERLLAGEQALFNVIPMGLSIVDARGRLLRRNATFEQIWSENALMVESKDEYREYKAWWTDSGKRLASEDWGLFRALTSGEVSLNEEIDIESFDGQRKTILHAAAPIYDHTGLLLGGVAAMLDITERKQLERRTHDALEALLSMAQVIVQGPTETDAEMLNLDESAHRSIARPIAQRLNDLAREVLACRQIAAVMIEPGSGQITPLAIAGLPPETEERWWREMSSAYASDFLDEQNIQRLLADEVIIMDLEHSSPFARDYYGFGYSLAIPILKENRIFGALTLDYGPQIHTYTEQEIRLARTVARLIALVVEREQLLTERAEARANEIALREANRLKDEFIGIAGHELRTPLTTIKATVQLAQRQLKRVMAQERPLPEDATKSITAVQGFLNRTERQIGMQNRLVNDLLDVSRVEMGRLELHPALYNILTLVSEVVEDQRYLTADRTITLTLPDEAELLVMVDVDRIRQVISNYLSNALKYSEADKPVAVDVETGGSRVRVAVRDEGPGLSESQQQHVWERFYRVPGVEVKTGSGVGLGLGLHISRMIIERQGGRVGLQSQPGKGSTFWFTLPLAE
jgi:signal transduction histidine kinase